MWAVTIREILCICGFTFSVLSLKIPKKTTFSIKRLPTFAHLCFNFFWNFPRLFSKESLIPQGEEEGRRKRGCRREKGEEEKGERKVRWTKLGRNKSPPYRVRKRAPAFFQNPDLPAQWLWELEQVSSFPGPVFSSANKRISKKV